MSDTKPILAGSSSIRIKANLFTATQCLDVAGTLLLEASDADEETLRGLLNAYLDLKTLSDRVTGDTPEITAAQRLPNPSKQL